MEKAVCTRWNMINSVSLFVETITNLLVNNCDYFYEIRDFLFLLNLCLKENDFNKN